MHEFPTWDTGTPYRHCWDSRLLGLVEAAYQAGEHVRSSRMEVVPRTVQVRRHGGDVVQTELPAQSLHVEHASDLRNRVRLIGRLKWTSQQAVLADRLRSELGIDATGAEEKQSRGAVACGRVQDVHLDA